MCECCFVICVFPSLVKAFDIHFFLEKKHCKLSRKHAVMNECSNWKLMNRWTYLPKSYHYRMYIFDIKIASIFVFNVIGFRAVKFWNRIPKKPLYLSIWSVRLKLSTCTYFSKINQHCSNLLCTFMYKTAKTIQGIETKYCIKSICHFLF